jgi:aminoglycoside phosphotransferase (APT) family kinase protein
LSRSCRAEITHPVPRPGVADVAGLQRRTEDALAQVWPGCVVRELTALPGGASSLTYAAELSSAPRDRVVVKMAPPGLPPLRNRDVLRQARLLRALARVPEVAVPAVYANDPGDPPEVPPLFVMDYVHGESYEPLLTAHGSRAGPPPDDQVAARALAAVRMLAALHRQDAAALALGAEPATSLAQECAKWARALSTCPLTGTEAALERACRRGLEREEPAPLPPAVLHGDWRLGNMQCLGREVRAVIDWEIWSIGDPRTDLAWMMMWASPDNPGAGPPGAFMIAPGQLLAWYEEAAGHPVQDLGWVQCLARYKSAATTALLAKNAAKRGESGEHVERMRRSIRGTLEWALAFLP